MYINFLIFFWIKGVFYFMEENYLYEPYSNEYNCFYIHAKKIHIGNRSKIKNLDLKQIYSYMMGECLCKDYISIEYIKAIGVPYTKMISDKGYEYMDRLFMKIDSEFGSIEEFFIKLYGIDENMLNALRDKFLVKGE